MAITYDYRAPHQPARYPSFGDIQLRLLPVQVTLKRKSAPGWFFIFDQTDAIIGGKVYILESRWKEYTAMRIQLQRATVFVLYQLSLLVGIALLPIALAMRRIGVVLPVHRVVDRLETAYDRTKAASA